ncbi:MAG: hypothetical protein LIP12_13180 [Clostridiales bacterium]|nr:hypothetical protein [Clostridiales bacterium]MCC8082575.1 hypothetical protein [Lachnospiraceae bacterium]
MRHNLSISVSKKPKDGIVSCRTVTVRERLLRRLLGLPQTVTIVVPGDSVDTVSITEVPEGGATSEAV